MARTRRPTTDSGTVVIHLALLVAFAVLLFTGLRIASDDPNALWLAALDPVLPVENLWYRHLVAALIMMATLAAYTVYILRARLGARIRLDRPRMSGILRAGAPRVAGLHALVYWGLILSLAVEIVTGAALFLDFGEPHLSLHLTATWVSLGCVLLHVLLQAAMGGVAQLTRIFRPAPLVVAPPPPDFAELLAEQLARKTAPSPPDRSITLNAHPIANGIAAAIAVGLLAAGAEVGTRPELHVRLIAPSDAPVLDGDLSHPVWMKTKPVSVLTSQGGDFGGSGESLVEIRAVHDGEFIYFAFTWTDPTRSLKHLPLVKTQDGWHVAQTEHDKADETRFHEDKFAVLFAPASLPLIGAAIHLSVAPRSDRPPGSTGRGLHYTSGFIADVWQWRASHEGFSGHIDNCHFGGAPPPTPEQSSGRARYAGGFALDPGQPVAYFSNVQGEAAKSSADRILPARLPRDVAAMSRALGRLSDSSTESESEGSRWWMTESESVPFSVATDAAIAAGTVIPGIVMRDAQPNERASVRGVGRWAAGRWTLEISRRLYTGSAYDLPMKTGILMWVAAFDHSETRHTRHLRPFRLEIE